MVATSSQHCQQYCDNFVHHIVNFDNIFIIYYNNIFSPYGENMVTILSKLTILWTLLSQCCSPFCQIWQHCWQYCSNILFQHIMSNLSEVCRCRCKIAKDAIIIRMMFCDVFFTDINKCSYVWSLHIHWFT